MVDFIVKLGGAALSDKQLVEHEKPEALFRAAQVLTNCAKAGLKFIILHGAGSFGHKIASDYSLTKGFMHLEKSNVDAVRYGACLCHNSVVKLASILQHYLTDAGLSSVVLSCFSTWMLDNGQVVKNGCDMVRATLAAGFIPILHGDVVLDSTRGCGILSSDTLAEILCKELCPLRVVFASDVPGIFDRPPEMLDARLLSNLYVTDDGNLSINPTTNVSNTDVTGGMRFKLQSAVNIVCQARGAVVVHICDVMSTDFQNLCLLGDSAGSQWTKIQLVK